MNLKTCTTRRNETNTRIRRLLCDGRSNAIFCSSVCGGDKNCLAGKKCGIGSFGPLFFFAGHRVRRFYINFPDPWFKRAQHNRRIVTPELACELAQLIAPDGEIFFSTAFNSLERGAAADSLATGADFSFSFFFCLEPLEDIDSSSPHPSFSRKYS